MSKKNNGYTLIELIVVLMLISLSLGIVAVNFAKVLPGAKLKSVVRELSATLRQAKNTARINSEEVVVSVDMDAKVYLYGNREKSFPVGVNVHVFDPIDGELDSDIWDVVYHPDGSSTGGEIIISNEKRAFSIEIDPLVGSVVNILKEE